MKNPQIVIPTSAEKIARQIEALEYFIAHDTDEFSRSTHAAALESLRAAYTEGSKQ